MAVDHDRRSRILESNAAAARAAELRGMEARLHMHRSGSDVMRVAARGNGRGGGLPAVRQGAGRLERPPGFVVLLWRALRCRFMCGIGICMMTVAAVMMLVIGAVWL